MRCLRSSLALAGRVGHAITHKGEEKDPESDQSYTPSENDEIWLMAGDAEVYSQHGAAESYALIHFPRSIGGYDDWGLHVWGDSAEPDMTWGNPLQPPGEGI